MRIWFDTEFIEDGNTIDLISIGMIRDDGRTYYAESSECNLNKASPWVIKNVLPHLKGGARSRLQIRDEVKYFCLVGEHLSPIKPKFWAYYADYDWVAFCQLFGRMIDLPEEFPKFCMDLKQAAVMAGDPKLVKQTNIEHHALGDAIWCRMAWYELFNNPHLRYLLK